MEKLFDTINELDRNLSILVIQAKLREITTKKHIHGRVNISAKVHNISV